MILTHESGSQEDQFDEKNGGQKSRDTIPLNADFFSSSNLKESYCFALSPRRPYGEYKRMVLEHTHGLFIT